MGALITLISLALDARRRQPIDEVKEFLWEMAQYDTWFGRQARDILGSP